VSAKKRARVWWLVTIPGSAFSPRAFQLLRVARLESWRGGEVIRVVEAPARRKHDG